MSGAIWVFLLVGFSEISCLHRLGLCLRLEILNFLVLFFSCRGMVESENVHEFFERLDIIMGLF